ncbi:MAG: hypothetical protein C4533_07480 [Candidatus Omnitrophota bacterium]|jgi:hypothetical protein|nr:MAG: hypothetical protein C4533_07480 [Candidatus Omnitrophota bacterium]
MGKIIKNKKRYPWNRQKASQGFFVAESNTCLAKNDWQVCAFCATGNPAQQGRTWQSFMPRCFYAGCYNTEKIA